LTVDTAQDFVDYTNNSELQNKQQQNALCLAQEDYSLDKAIAKYDVILQTGRKLSPVDYKLKINKSQSPVVKGVPIKRPEKLQKTKERIG
jgi:hypothetical protein